MTRATDLRYGRRGGGWVPSKPVKEHRMPHTYTELPCPERSCAGMVRRPNVRGDVWIEQCDGEFAHEWTVTAAGTARITLLPPTDPPPAPSFDVVKVSGTFDASQQFVDELAECPIVLPGLGPLPGLELDEIDDDT